MMKNIKNRLGFSMLELIFVIIILGIVASIGAEVIAKVYESYIVQRAHHRASIKTQLALNQITNRLRYAIPGTIVRRVTKTGTAEELSATMASGPDSYNVLQWVASDGDSFEAINSSTTSGAERRPGWSGFCDVDASSGATNIPTPGSNLGLANTIIKNLSNNAKSVTTATLFFPKDLNAYDISTASGEVITLSSNPSNRIVERYKLAWTSYALVVESGDLFLYYNLPPTIGASIGATKSLLLKNVTNFKFEGRGQTTRIKICVEEFIDGNVSGTGIPSCKEKAVF